MSTIKKEKRRILSIIVAFIVGITGFGIWNIDGAEAASVKYLLKVNTTKNVVTAYKYTKGKWRAVRAMTASVGKPSTPTVHGTFEIASKRRWGLLGGPGIGAYSYGQYVTEFYGNYLFHSVPYDKKNPATLKKAEYAKLGKPASHGCVRLATVDAKWIYYNCKAGTKVRIFKSNKNGPLGKPKPLKATKRWDPTDTTKGNPTYNLRKAIINIDKYKTTEYKQKYSLMMNVRAINPNANENITDKIKIRYVSKWDQKTKKYVKTSFSNEKVGKYKIVYRVDTAYCKPGYGVHYVSVLDRKTPTISNAVDRTVNVGDVDAVGNVTAKQLTRDLTKDMEVQITKPDGTEINLNYSQAKTYIFDENGEYFVTYHAQNIYKPYREISKTIAITAVSANN